MVPGPCVSTAPPGRRAALPSPSPLRTVHARCPRTRLKQATCGARIAWAHGEPVSFRRPCSPVSVGGSIGVPGPSYRRHPFRHPALVLRGAYGGLPRCRATPHRFGRRRAESGRSCDRSVTTPWPWPWPYAASTPAGWGHRVRLCPLLNASTLESRDRARVVAGIYPAPTCWKHLGCAS